MDYHEFYYFHIEYLLDHIGHGQKNNYTNFCNSLFDNTVYKNILCIFVFYSYSLVLILFVLVHKVMDHLNFLIKLYHGQNDIYPSNYNFPVENAYKALFYTYYYS